MLVTFVLSNSEFAVSVELKGHWGGGGGNVQWNLNKRSNQFNRKGPGKALRCSEMPLWVEVGQKQL